MVSRRVSRSVRRLAGGLVVLAFLAAVAAPAQAAPRGSATPVALEIQVLDWIQDVLARLGFFTPQPPPAAPRDEGPRSMFAPDETVCDPNGSPCPEDTSISLPLNKGLEPK